jgi:hypothetical protein
VAGVKLELTSDGRFAFSLTEAIDDLSQSQRWEIVQTLACNQALFDEVVNQILDGYTSEGWYGPKGYGGKPDATHGIDGARMRIAKGASDVALAEIESLKRAIKSANDLGQKGWDAYHELIRSRL